MSVNTAGKSYEWQETFDHDWRGIDEVDYDSLIRKIQNERTRKPFMKPKHLRLGMMRFMLLFIDLSESMKIIDLRPTRLDLVLKNAIDFVEQFFDQNPISQLGICFVRNGTVHTLTQLGGNPDVHLKGLKDLASSELTGDFSLENILLYSEAKFKNIPHYASREVTIVMSSLTSTDQHNIHTNIESAQHHRIRCSVISLTCEVFIFKKLTKDTKGLYQVLLDESDLKFCFQNLITPPPCLIENDATMISVGFPNNKKCTEIVICSCHKKIMDEDVPMFICPRCSGAYCSLPVECVQCGLILLSAPHLARSYHHLFPLAEFKLADPRDSDSFQKCSGCNSSFTNDSKIFSCEGCNKGFCDQCNDILHTSIHVCPNCSEIGLKESK